MKKRRSFNL